MNKVLASGFWTLALACALPFAPTAQATDLMQAWEGAARHDPQSNIAEAARAAGASRRAQADALWRPNVVLSGTAGRASANSSMTGAHFFAPGFGDSSGVAFGTSVSDGNSTRWALSARQPLYNPERNAQRQQLQVGADAADLLWHARRQELMLLTAQRYFGVSLAERRLALVRQQEVAVERALTEARDRFSIGDAPITDTHEASARASALRAQGLAADNELRLARAVLSDSTGIASAQLQARPPSRDVASDELQSLEHWLALVQAGNLELRIQQTNVESARQEAAKYAAASAPTLDLIAQAGRDRLSGSGDFGNASTTQRQAMVGVQLNVPLYTGGWRNAKLEEALRLEDKARAEVEQTRQQISQQTLAAWTALQTAQARQRALLDAVTASHSRLEATRLGRQVGDRTTMDLLNAENDAAAADLALLQVRIELLLSRLRLAALAGQLDEEQLQRANGLLQP
jgi:outer membrane protein